VPDEVSKCVRVGCEAEHVNVATRKVKPERRCSGDARIEWGEHLQHAALRERVLI